MFLLIDQTRLQLGDVMNPAALQTLLQLPRVGAMKSDVLEVNSCKISRALWTGALSCQHRSLPKLRYFVVNI